MNGRASTSTPKFGARGDGTVSLPGLNSVVCVSNPDANRRLSLDECIIGRVKKIFYKEGIFCCDLILFARPNLFPHDVDRRNYDLHQFREVVEDMSRANEATFPVDDIFTECKIITGDSQISVDSILRRYSRSASPQKINLPIFVQRFCLLEKEPRGFFLQPLKPSPVQEMFLAKPEVLSETGTNVKRNGHITPSYEDVIKPAQVVVEDCSSALFTAKENVIGFDYSSQNREQLLLPSHHPPETTSGMPSKLVGSPQSKRFSVKRSLDLDGSPRKRFREDPEAQRTITGGNWECPRDETAFMASEETNKHNETAWVSKLLEVNEPVIHSGGLTPIRLSLKRVRLNATPPKQPDRMHDKESDGVEADGVQTSSRKNRSSMIVTNNSESEATPKKISEVSSLKTGHNMNVRSSRRKLSVACEDNLPEVQVTTRKSASLPGNEILDGRDIFSPDESGMPLACRTPHRTSRRKSRTGCEDAKPETQRTPRRPQRACTVSSKSYNESLDENILSPEGTKISEAGKTHGGTRKSLRTLRKSDRSPTPDQNISSGFISPDESESTTPRKPSKSSTKAAKKLSKTPKTTPAKSCRTPRAKTPSKTPLKGCLTPSMPARASAPLSTISSLEHIRKNLHVSAVPMSLPCRESEYRNIYNFLENKIVDAAGGCMYISGVPGTGKTATVHAVIRSLKEQVEQKQLKDFQYIEVNGLRMTEPRQVFVQVLKVLTGQKRTPQQAQDILSQRFCFGSSKNKTVVLLVDEVDMLRNRRQDVIYNLFDWPSKPNSRLIVLTIANTMDLPERLLKGRVTSRLGLTRLTFQPYSYKQLQEIVMSRLQGSDCFNDDAVELVARKVAACSGDVRRALDICRRASEFVEEGSHVSMPIVNKVLSQMMNSANVCSIKACSKLEKLFLQAVVAENERTGVEEATFFAVYRQFQSLCALASTALINISEAMGVLNRLGASGLLLTEHSRADINQSIFLNVNTDDVHYALNKTASTS